MKFSFRKPTWEEQDKWIMDYVKPVLTLNWNEAINNYKHNKRITLRRDMAKAGVLESLARLERKGTSWDRLVSDMKNQIKTAEQPSVYELFGHKLIERMQLLHDVLGEDTLPKSFGYKTSIPPEQLFGPKLINTMSLVYEALNSTSYCKEQRTK